MTEKKETPEQSPEWGGWVVTVETSNGSRWVNGIYEDQDTAELHAAMERKEGRQATALCLWLLGREYLHYVEEVALEAGEAGLCWKCGASNLHGAALCPECLTQQ